MSLEYEIQPVSTDVPAVLSPREEVMGIVNEFSLGLALREVALFRIYRMWDSDAYINVYSDGHDGTVATQREFSSFAEFIKFFTVNLDISRSKIYSRLKAYSLLRHLRYSEYDMLNMMASKPSLYERALNMIFLWDQESRSPTGFKTDVFGDNPFSDDAIEAVRDFLHDLDGAGSINEALSMLAHDILGKPTIKIRLEHDALTVYYARNDIDGESGEEIIGESGEVTFEPSGSLPDWVVDELSKKFPQR